MRFFFFLLLFLVSCVGFNSEKTKKIYICGNHECKNKKEIREYFENNISVEVYTITASKKQSQDVDLVQLNISDKEKKEYVALSTKEENIKKKIEKRKKISEINIKQEKKTRKIQKKRKKKKTSPVTLVRLCKNLEECDIDEVAKIILEMGKKKEFPDLTIN